MAYKIFTEATDKRIQSIMATINLCTIVGGEPDDAEPGKHVEEAIFLTMSEPSRTAVMLTFVWARINGVPFEKSAVDDLIKALQKEKPRFDRRKITTLGRRVGSKATFTFAVLSLHGARRGREEIYSETWKMFHIRPEPDHGNLVWTAHKKRVESAIYNNTVRPKIRKRSRNK